MSGDIITIQIKDFCRHSGISRTQVYRLLDRGTRSERPEFG
jgi:hypothetical protein